MNNLKSSNIINNNTFFDEKIKFFQSVIEDTIISCQRYKIFDILTTNEINICIQNLEQQSQILKNIHSNTSNENKLDILQKINNELSSIIKIFGTSKLNDLITICLNKNFISENCTTKEQ